MKNYAQHMQRLLVDAGFDAQVVRRDFVREGDPPFVAIVDGVLLFLQGEEQLSEIETAFARARKVQA